MDNDLKNYLDSIRADMSNMKSDMSNMKSDMSNMKSELKADIERVRVELKADIERVETALLTEFHKWASPAEARARTHTATLRAIDLEMESLTERVQKLENGQAEAS